jgi:hypothetical protein
MAYTSFQKIMKLLLPALVLLLPLGAVNAQIVQPEVRKLSCFYHVSGKNEDNEAEDHFLRTDTILRISIFEKVAENKSIFEVSIITKEFSNDFFQATGSNNGVAGASTNTTIRLIFRSHKEALDFISIFLTESPKAGQDGADQPATAPELKSEGKDKPQPEKEVSPR